MLIFPRQFLLTETLSSVVAITQEFRRNLMRLFVAIPCGRLPKNPCHHSCQKGLPVSQNKNGSDIIFSVCRFFSGTGWKRVKFTNPVWPTRHGYQKGVWGGLLLKHGLLFCHDLLLLLPITVLQSLVSFKTFSLGRPSCASQAFSLKWISCYILCGNDLPTLNLLPIADHQSLLGQRNVTPLSFSYRFLSIP